MGGRTMMNASNTLGATLLLVSALLHLMLMSTGCVNPISANVATRYYGYGNEWEQAGNLEKAHMCYARAYWHAQGGNLGNATEAYTLYEWARVSGYLGHHKEAERRFIKTLQLVDDAKGKADALRLPLYSEMARFYHDTGDHARAVGMYSNAVSLATQHSIDLLDPGELTDLYNEYLESLVRSAAPESLVSSVREQRDAWVKAHPAPAKAKYRRYNTSNAAKPDSSAATSGSSIGSPPTPRAGASNPH